MYIITINKKYIKKMKTNNNIIKLFFILKQHF